jgi:hypothetical protein
MLLFRSLVLGLLGACILLLAMRPPTRLRIEHDRTVIYRPSPPVATLVDVANGVPLAQLASLVRLGGGERVIAVDDRAVTGDLAAGAALATLEARPRFVDLTVAGGHAGERRVVLLLH